MLAVSLAAVDRAEALGLRGLPVGVPLEAEVLVVPEHDLVAGRQDEPALRLGGMAAGGEAGLLQGVRPEEAELVEGGPRPARVTRSTRSP